MFKEKNLVLLSSSNVPFPALREEGEEGEEREEEKEEEEEEIGEERKQSKAKQKPLTSYGHKGK